ncbi:M23 family metallopeptidase [Spirulina sp. 06S082]|uniref:M23 family metallopeptidase n=1 Tax=Spirulina sp. 06S082 TaxID=3110248 RepID=UPI002B20190A|nr:M23 family metallopeptidase [Spirulina sp. 06S082]MEA5471945.1 M23 family metallopeptidase [Spirulina sp. 06S082]
MPSILIGWLAFVPSRNLLGMGIQSLVTAIALVAIATMGIWIFPPWWTPYLYGVLFMLAVGLGFLRHQPKRRMPLSWLGWLMVIGFVAFGVYAGNEVARSWTGQFPAAAPAVDLTFPLRGDNFLILNGGSNIRINAHLKTLDESVPRFQAYRGQSYGTDIIQVNRWGLRSPGITPKQPAAYLIYGATVFAPCAGQVVQAIDGFPDMTIPETDLVNRAGNHVILRCGESEVILAHFRPQSLLVRSGMAVAVGDALAEVGNSGASTEPHLHIHAQRPGSSAVPLSGDPLPVRFDGRFLTRGDRVTLRR